MLASAPNFSNFFWYFRYLFYFPLPFYTKTVSHTPSVSLEPWPRNAHGQTLSRLWSWTMPCSGGVNIYKERPPWNHGITRCLTAGWEVLPRSLTPPLQDGSTYPLQLLGVLTPSKELPSAQRNPSPKSRPVPGVSHIQGWGAMTRSLPPIRIGEACAVTAHVCTTSPSAQSFPSSPQVGTQRALLWNLLEGRCSSQSLSSRQLKPEAVQRPFPQDLPRPWRSWPQSFPEEASGL